jgi:type III secretion protein L
MVIWLSEPHKADADASQKRFGVHGDIVARETFGALVDLDTAYARAAEDAQAELDAAREEAARIVEEGRMQAQRMLDEARAEHEQASSRGFDEGMAQGIAEWLDTIARAGGEARASEAQMRSRMAEIVAMAVEQIVRTEGVGALFERALVAVDGIVEGSTYLRVAVHPDDLDDARAAFEAFARRWRELGRPLPLTVTADTRLARGSCLCESDLGFIDASVTTQLRTMRAAISRALKVSVQEDAPEDTV